MHPFEVGSVIGFVRRVDGQPEAVSGVCRARGAGCGSTSPIPGCAARATRRRSRRRGRC